MSVIAVLCSDMHLSLKSPVARSAEPDWFQAMWIIGALVWGISGLALVLIKHKGSPLPWQWKDDNDQPE